MTAKENKTSQAVEFLLNQKTSSPEAGVMMAKKSTFKAIAEKYKRMEEALHSIREKSYKGPASTEMTDIEMLSNSALSFDPLS